ncbi:MAG TPA: VWA domain-containing protein [Planctomycetota bacterium]|nr:VWA domain-containing protein [Planctomycetota bacterium]
MMPEIHLLEPYALALALPALVAWWLWLRRDHGGWLRLLVLALLVIAATRPELAWERGGSDVVLVLDRSASMGDARAHDEELIRLVGEQRRTGDRLGVVLMGDGAVIAQGF